MRSTKFRFCFGTSRSQQKVIACLTVLFFKLKTQKHTFLFLSFQFACKNNKTHIQKRVIQNKCNSPEQTTRSFPSGKLMPSEVVFASKSSFNPAIH
jgi:hypothetical protein